MAQQKRRRWHDKVNLSGRTLIDRPVGGMVVAVRGEKLRERLLRVRTLPRLIFLLCINTSKAMFTVAASTRMPFL